ncbi:MAG TPA: S24 family peptidase [Candidatus Saccharimonadales bacterium]|nr:S24 family peptidase [Candidatus Saccharimonadales bacterium]
MITTDQAVAKLREFYRTHERMPSYEEMRKIFHYQTKGSAYYLAHQLIKDGILEKDSDGKLLPKKLYITLPAYGLIKAGVPQEAASEVVDQISFDTYLIHNPNRSFVLTVSGDSMIDAGLHDGDRVIVDMDIEPKNFDIVAAHVDNEWTLKYFEKKDGKIRLVPANPKYQPIEPKLSLTIGGVVVSSVRKYH